MDSLSGKQVKELKELYNSMYKVEQPVGESISEVNFEEYFESLSEEKKKNFFQRVFDKFMQGPDYGNKRKKAEEDKIDKQVDDYVNKNKGDKPINKVKVDDDQSGSAVLTKKNDTKKDDTKQEPIIINIPGGTKKIFPASPEYEKIKSGELTTSKSDSSMVGDVTNIKKDDKGVVSGELKKPTTSAMGTDVKEIEKQTQKDLKDPKNKVKKEKPLLSKKLPDTTKLGSSIRPVKPGSARDKMIAKNEIKLGTDRISNLRKQNADFQAMKKGDISKMDFMKQYPGSQTTKKYNLKQIKMGKPTIKSHYEPYDLVLDYILSEGHADTVEEAHYVMTQMDADTIQTIVEEKKTL